MPISTFKATLQQNINDVWNLVTSLEDYRWRSDLETIEIIEPNKKFAEITKDGFRTIFTITAFIPNQRYAFDLENENMKGQWTGVFLAEGKATTIEFTEDVTAKKMLLKPLVKTFLKKQQAAYLKDLKTYFNE